MLYFADFLKSLDLQSDKMKYQTQTVSFFCLVSLNAHTCSCRIMLSFLSTCSFLSQWVPSSFSRDKWFAWSSIKTLILLAVSHVMSYESHSKSVDNCRFFHINIFFRLYSDCRLMDFLHCYQALIWCRG